MFNKLFKKKAKKTVEVVDVPRAEIPKIEVEKVEPERVSIFTMRYRDTETGEIHTFDASDFDAFDKVMSNPKNQLMFG